MKGQRGDTICLKPHNLKLSLVGGPRNSHFLLWSGGAWSSSLGPWESPSSCVSAGVLVALAVMMLTKSTYCFGQPWESSRWASPEPGQMKPQPSGCGIKAEGLWSLQQWHFHESFKAYTGANLTEFKKMLNLRGQGEDSSRKWGFRGQIWRSDYPQEGLVIGLAEVQNDQQRAAKTLVRRQTGLMSIGIIPKGWEMDRKNEKGPPPPLLKEQPLDLGSQPLKKKLALSFFFISCN